MAIDRFIGVWRLVALEVTIQDGTTMDDETIIYPYGKDPVGMIIYDRDGYVSSQFMKTGRPSFASGDIANGTPEESKAAFDGYMGYFGRYEVDESNCTITYQLQGCHFPNWVGHDQKRSYKFSDDNHLTITTPPIGIRGTTLTFVLVWERYKQV